MARLVSIDFLKGISILCMVVVHSVLSGIANWDSEVLLNYADRLPSFATYIIVLPGMILGKLGSIFTFCTGITTALSAISIMETKPKMIFFYLFKRFLFGIVLKVLEGIYNTILYNSSFFKSFEFDFVTLKFDKTGETTDAIAWAGFFVPLFIALFMSIRFLKDPRCLLVLLNALLIISWGTSPYLLDFCDSLVIYLNNHELYFLAILINKISQGPFMVGQYLPYGYAGACFSIILHYYKSWRVFWIYSVVNVVIFLTFGCMFFFIDGVDNIVDKVMADHKNIGYLMINLALEQFFFFISYYELDYNHNLKQLYSWRKGTTFLRELSSVSLSAFLLEGFVSVNVIAWFSLIFGNAIDLSTKQILWNPIVLIVYAAFVGTLWIFIAKGWGKIGMRFSIEYQIACILNYILNPSNYPKGATDFIYSPNKETAEKIQKNTVDIELAVAPKSKTLSTDSLDTPDVSSIESPQEQS
ncbi:hypothetical protein WA158_002684 [Blastocystis sp. Blastoise]